MTSVPPSFPPPIAHPPTSGKPRVFSGRVIFDHLQKTAGMAINRWLRSTLGDGCASPNLIADHGSLIARYGGRYSVLTAHIAFDGRGLDPRYQYVTLVREPVDRMTSWLHYVVGDHTAAEVGEGWHMMSRFLDSRGASDDYALPANICVRHFAAIEGVASGADDALLAAALTAVERYDVWGLYESLPEFLEDFASLLGVHAPSAIARVNVTTRRPSVAELPAALRQKLLQRCALDLEMYEILKGRHAEARRRMSRASVAIPSWEPMDLPPPRTAVRPGFTLHDASIRGGAERAKGDLLDFEVAFSLDRPIEELVVAMVISDSLGNRVFVTQTTQLGQPIRGCAAGSHQLTCSVVAHLPEGEYSVGFRFRELRGELQRELATLDGLCMFRIGRPSGAPLLQLPTTIRCVAVDASTLDCGWRLEATDPGLASSVGRIEGTSVVSDGRAGHLLFGPYRSLVSGRWTAVVEGLLAPGQGSIRVDVASHAGRTVHAVLELRESSDRATIDFELAHPVHDLEVRVWVHEFATARIDGIAVTTRKSSPTNTGAHEHEVTQGHGEAAGPAMAGTCDPRAAAQASAAGPNDRIHAGDGAVGRGTSSFGAPKGGPRGSMPKVPADEAAGPMGEGVAADDRGSGQARPHDARGSGQSEQERRASGHSLTGSLPNFSIVIATDGRSSALAELLDALPYLEGPAFEVCVVRGPTEDGIAEVLAPWRDRIKTAQNPLRNLSASRNLGIAMSAGDIIAFLDDDAIPEPDWLVELASAFEDPRVACAGGVNLDRKGGRQYGYSTANRMGHARWDHADPPDALCVPFASDFPYTQGTNTAVRRTDLEALRGFDEEYDFYLDETDLCCRLVDAGRIVRQMPRALVHHRSLGSAIRTDRGVTHALGSVLKSKLYFSLINNHGHHTTEQAMADFESFVAIQGRHLRQVAEGAPDGPNWLARFDSDTEHARTTGLARGNSGMRRLMSPGLASRHRQPFLPLERRSPSAWQSCTLHQTSTPAATTLPALSNDPVGAQRSLLRRIWSELIPTGTQVAIALRPEHRNVGDSAIWWGTCSLLESLGVHVRYECGPASYDPDALSAAHPDGPILLLGGGNLGDVYGDEQGLRMRILSDFAHRPIIQLPQSTWFRSADSRDVMAAALSRCANVTLMLRDASSLAFARTHFPVRSLACPDAALALDLAHIPRTADVPVLALWRHDIEHDRPLPPLPQGSLEIDWEDRGSLPARERTLHGCRLLARGRVVITNRLHAHLLCTLMRIPHVVCDTVNGKLSAYRDTWDALGEERDRSAYVRFAASPEEAVAIATSLADALGSPGQEVT